MSKEVYEQFAKADVLGGMSPGVAISPILMGAMIDAALLGVMLSQLIHWVGHQRQHESRLTQAAVWWCTALGILGTVLAAGWIVYLFGFNYGLYVPLTDIRWFSWFPFIDALIVVVVQTFFAQRAFKIAGRPKILIPIVATPMLLAFSGGVGVAICAMIQPFAIGRAYEVCAWLWTSGTCAADVIITAIVLWGLNRSRSEWEQTDILVKKLIRIACESQLPPTIVATAFLLDWAIQRITFYGVFFEMIQGKLYVTSMVYVLNQRYYLRRELDGDPNHAANMRAAAVPFNHPPTTQPPTFGFPNNAGAHVGHPNHGRVGPAQIHVQTDTYVESHRIDPSFIPQTLPPKIREVSESDDTEMSNLDGVNESQVGLGSEYMGRVEEVRKKPQAFISSFAQMG